MLHFSNAQVVGFDEAIEKIYALYPYIKPKGISLGNDFVVNKEDLELLYYVMQSNKEILNISVSFFVECTMSFYCKLLGNNYFKVFRASPKAIFLQDFSLEQFEYDKNDRTVKELLETNIAFLNEQRRKFFNTQDEKYIDNTFHFLPQCYKLKCHVIVNYCDILDILKLNEEGNDWKQIITFFTKLPHIKELKKIEENELLDAVQASK